MSDEPRNMDLSTNLTALTLANQEFSFSLYNELTKTNTGNMFFSPFSIHVIMFMASVGATSKTFDEMIATIRLNKTTHSLEAYQDLLENLTSDEDVLKVATGMFIDNAFNVKSSFVENSSKYLKSTTEKLNFSNDPETQRQYLNNWVLNKTNNKIKDLFPPGSINEGTALVLANAVHFKHSWRYKFTNTEDEPFYLTPINKVTVQMMSLRHDLQYYHDDDLKFAALELPYQHSFKMLILLPDDKDGLIGLENNLSKIKLNEISDKMTEYNVNVKLPRFKLEQSFDLKKTLSNLGCPTMFSKDANFSNIVEHPKLSVSKVFHKAFIEVDENGTEAAAATGMAMFTRCLMTPSGYDEVDFFANYPFIFFILGQNNELLFFGRVFNCSENEKSFL